MSAKILILEDDVLFCQTLQDFLSENGYEVEVSFNPKSALELTYDKKFDLYILDVNLPFEDGFLFLKNLRDSGDETPAVFLTSREDKESLKEGFLSGGDDFIKKPVDFEELLLRIEAILKRTKRQKILNINGFKIDLISKTVSKDNKLINLNPKEIELLILLIENKNSVVTLNQIINRLWASSQNVSQGAIRVYINSLKKYFANNIKNKRGVGYIFTKD
jgi:DNA-binding response OmpR family regulator